MCLQLSFLLLTVQNESNCISMESFQIASERKTEKFPKAGLKGFSCFEKEPNEMSDSGGDSATVWPLMEKLRLL